MNSKTPQKIIFFLLAFLHSLPIFASSIIENKGQINQALPSCEQILFYTSIDGGTAYFLKDRIAFVLFEKTDKKMFNDMLIENKINVFRYDYKINSSSEIILEKGKEQSEKLNFYKNGKHFSANQFDRIIYKNISNATSIVFYNHPDKGLKYDIVFENPLTTEVQFSFELIGTTARKSFDKKNSKELLIIETPLGELTEQFPLVYADVKKNKKIIREENKCNITINEHTIVYTASVPKNCQSIVIDPWISFAGGGDADECYGVSGDNNGNIYISGYTSSLDFPTTAGSFQPSINANYDAYIFKFNATGQRIWSTYYGGSQNDFGYRLKVSPSGKPTLSGYTYSNDLFVSTSGVFSSTFSGVVDAFITQFDANGIFLWGTFIGGTGGDFAISMDMDKRGNIALGGFTSSNDFPVSASAWQPLFGGALDSFIAKFDSTGNRIWSTYLGGLNSEDAHAIQFDSIGNVIVAGDTYSTNFPVDITSYQNFLMGGSDAFVAKYDSTGNKTWSTYLGGVGNEDIYGLACDNSNNIYFTGYSTSNDFPITAGAFQTTMNGVRDLSVGSFNASGNLRWLTYAGGSAWDTGRGMIVNTNQKITVCGETSSSDFPIVGNKFDTINNGGSDIVYMTFDSTGTVELSNLNGGNSADYAYDICEVQGQKIAISGNTYSADFPVTAGAFQTIKSADVDAFVWHIDSTSILTNTYNYNLNSNSFLYPNPANDKAIITGISSGKYVLIIYDFLGQEIRKTTLFTNGTIELSNLENLPNGVYSIMLISSSKSATYKLVKSH